AISNARVRLPDWVNRFEGARSLQVYWDSVYRSLDLHERGHVQISLEGAKDMERALNEIPEQPTCEAVTAEAHRRAQQVWSMVQRRQMAYDAETDHGRRQWSPYRD
ncbi:MAG TPA: DUF922 domain-containing protein, partial [Usitatibacter sp.]|nr:DUF922 domain-containing protein [Usitatibacter sp.]